MLKFTSNLVHYGASLHQRLEDVNDHRKHYESKTLNVCINTYILLHLPKFIYMYLCDLEKLYMKWLRYQQLPHLLGTGYATVGELRDQPVTSVALWMNAGAKSREHAHTHTRGTHSRRHADGCLPQYQAGVGLSDSDCWDLLTARRPTADVAASAPFNCRLPVDWKCSDAVGWTSCTVSDFYKSHSTNRQRLAWR